MPSVNYSKFIFTTKIQAAHFHVHEIINFIATAKNLIILFMNLYMVASLFPLHNVI